MKPPPQKAREAPVAQRELPKAGPLPGAGRGVALLSPAEVAHAYLQLKRRLDTAVARLTPPPHPFCREELVFTHGVTKQHFYGGVSQEHWTLRLECKGKFTLVYQRQEGSVVVAIEMIEGFYKLAVPPELGLSTGYVPLPAMTGTLRSTIELHSVLRVKEHQSPVHWAQETKEEAEPWEDVFVLDLYPPSDPEYGEMRGFPQADLRQDEGSAALLLQRARSSAAEKACHTEVLLRRRTLAGDPALAARIPMSAVKHLGRSLMPVDVDSRSPLRAFGTMHTSFPPAAMRRSVSTGCLVSAGWGYDKSSMCNRGRVPFLAGLTNRVS